MKAKKIFIGFLKVFNPGFLNIICLILAIYLIVTSSITGKGYFIQIQAPIRVNDTYLEIVDIYRLDFNIILITYVLFSSLCTMVFYLSQISIDSSKKQLYRRYFFILNSIRYALFIGMNSLSANVNTPLQLIQFTIVGLCISYYIIQDKHFYETHGLDHNRMIHVPGDLKQSFKLQIIVFINVIWITTLIIIKAARQSNPICNIVSSTICSVLLFISLWLDTRRWGEKYDAYDIAIYVGVMDFFFTVCSITFSFLYERGVCISG